MSHAAVESLPTQAECTVDLLACAVVVAGQRVRLTRGQLGVLLHLAIVPNGVSFGMLGDNLAPLLDERSAARSLKVLVHRLRRRLGFDTIKTVVGGYRISQGVVTDLRACELAVRTYLKLDDPCACDIAPLEAIYARLRERHENLVRTNWTWFESTEQRLHFLELEIALFLANAAFRNGNFERAAAFAQAAVELDPLEERSREIIISVALARGESSVAVAEYRRFAATLAREDVGSPSENLRALLRL